MALEALLGCTAALLAIGAGALVIRHRIVVYGLSLGVTSVAFVTALASLLSPASLGATLALPVGLPWLGAHSASTRWPRSSWR